MYIFADEITKLLNTMAKVKYYARENRSLGSHSFYAVAVPNGTMSFDEVCEDAARNTTIEPSLMRAAVTEYIHSVQRNALLGFRVPIGEDFVMISPYLKASVKDKLDEYENVSEVATEESLNANKGRSTLSVTISPRFCRKFANNVSWQKVDRHTGEAVDEKGDE